MALENGEKFDKELTCRFKTDIRNFNEFWPKHSKVSKICTLMDCFWSKCIIFMLRKYRGAMFDSTEDCCKIWRKIDLCFQKWHEEFTKFSPEHVKVSKLGFWQDSFMQSRKCVSLKFTGELCVMTMMNNVKWEKELTCLFKIYMRNLTDFDPSTQKSQKYGLQWAAFDQSI